MRAARERNKKYYDRKARAGEFKPGDWVYYWHPAMDDGPCPKFNQHWHPRYRIVARKSPVNYIIRHQPSGETKVVHGNHLQLARGDPAWDQHFSEPERILGKRPETSRFQPLRWEVERTPERRQPLRPCRVSTPLERIPEEPEPPSPTLRRKRPHTEAVGPTTVRVEGPSATKRPCRVPTRKLPWRHAKKRSLGPDQGPPASGEPSGEPAVKLRREH